MEQVIKSSSSPTVFWSYFSMTKPGIVFGNLITAAAAFLLASQESVDGWLLMATLLGLALMMAAGCVFNNYIDRKADQKMKRTEERVLAKGVVSSQAALFFGAVLAGVSVLILSVWTHPLILCITLFGLFVYVPVYSLMKYRSSFATLIGSLAGATPPLVGYCAVTHQVDVVACLLFALLVCWQMPHFFAIALYRLEDYERAEIPVLPLKKGILTTKKQMIYYILGFLGVALLIPLVAPLDEGYLLTTIFLTLLWLFLSLWGFRCKDDQRWARKMFVFSLVVIVGICTAIVF